MIDTSAARLHGVAEGTTLRERIPRLLWQHTVEDGDSVVTLVERQNLGSARALLRPQLESLARAAWARVHATELDLERFANGTQAPPPISQIMDLLDRPGGHWTVRGTRIPFENIWRERGAAFHDTSHRGTRAIARAAAANQGGGNYEARDELSILYIACSCAGISAAALLEDVARTDDAEVVWNATAAYMDYVHQQP